ncbi:MAG: hypothetical protein ACXWV9_05325, partial [Flavisolibacter sp.]
MVSTRSIKPVHEVYPTSLRIAARVISYIFHPLFIPVYVILFLIYEANLFPDKTEWQKSLVLIQFVVSYTLLPLITILLMKALGFVKSVYLKTQKDRILPYVVCQVFYFWAWYVSKNVEYPKMVVMFTLAVFLASALGLILNSYLKISMHTISLGVVCALLLIGGMLSSHNYGPYIAIAFLIAGLTCTARLIDSNHSTREVYLGFFAGALAQVI